MDEWITTDDDFDFDYYDAIREEQAITQMEMDEALLWEL